LPARASFSWQKEQRHCLAKTKERKPTPKEPYSLSLEITASICTTISVITSTSDSILKINCAVLK
jgi:hypothetical protein